MAVCRNCGSPFITRRLFLGFMPLVNDLRPVGEPPRAEMHYPLDLFQCAECLLVQLGYEVPPSILFPPNYPYRSASTRALHADFEDLAFEAAAVVGLSSGDCVVDIGANDGTLLSKFPSALTRIGFEPTDAADAALPGARMIKKFFGRDTTAGIRAKLVVASNVFAHVPDLRGFLAGVRSVLLPGGVFVTESQHLDSIQYDTVYHEHLRYYSLRSVSDVLRRGGLEVFRAKLIPTHGGSARVYAGYPGEHPVEASVGVVLASETPRLSASFGAAVALRKRRLLALLAEVGPVYGVGAPSRASTLVNYCGIDKKMMPCVCEVASSLKVGHFMPGTRIPVVDEMALIVDQPPCALLLSWHVADELVPALRARGYRGRFVVPLPEPGVYETLPAGV